jgi:tryptophanyl-tRNA synthetase
VLLIDSPDEIRRTIKRAVTDTGRDIVFSEAPEKAGVNNLLEIYELLTSQPRTEIEAHFAGKGYGALKGDVAEVVIESLRPIRERFNELMSNTDELDAILDDGAERARAVSEPKVKDIKRRVGFIVR